MMSDIDVSPEANLKEISSMSNRRYDDEEIREIFQLATTGVSPGRPLPAESGGMTLDQLKQIGN